MDDYKVVTYKEEAPGLKKSLKRMFFWEILQGMGLTLKRAFSKPITMRYPENKWFMSERMRGQVALVRDPEKPDEDLCVGCCLCVRVCPSGALDMITSMGEDNKKIIDEYFLDMTRCIFCGSCVEICPVSALVNTDNHELAQYDRQLLQKINKESLLKTGHAWRERVKLMQNKGLQQQTVIKVKRAKWTHQKPDINEKELDAAPKAANSGK
jgi:NADH-quinone oxidoreductase chain I